NVFRAYVKAGRHKDGRRYRSYRDIARELNGIVGKSTLARWMAQDFPEVAARLAAGREDDKRESDLGSTQRSRYELILPHVEQITAAAGALPSDDRQRLAQRLTEAAVEVVGEATPWEPEAFDLWTRGCQRQGALLRPRPVRKLGG